MINKIFPVEEWKFRSEWVMHGLPPSDLTKLMAHQTIKKYRKGEILFREGGQPSGIFYVKTGMAKKYKLDEEGREHIIYVANQGEWLGYHAILSGDRYPDSAALLEDSVVAYIPREDFLHVLDTSPELSKRLLVALSHEFSVFVNTVALMSGKSVRQRLALQLILLREKYKTTENAEEPIAIRMSREDLASLIGTVKENVVRILTEFKAQGLLRSSGRTIYILEPESLLRASSYL